MRRSILGAAGVAVIGLSAAIGSAYSQDAVIEEDLMMEEGPMIEEGIAEPEPEVMPPESNSAPRVRGFTAREAPTCGEFKYWDGTQCADARDKKATPAP